MLHRSVATDEQMPRRYALAAQSCSASRSACRPSGEYGLTGVNGRLTLKHMLAALGAVWEALLVVSDVLMISDAVRWFWRTVDPRR
jgi:hypothetical protein